MQLTFGNTKSFKATIILLLFLATILSNASWTKVVKAATVDSIEVNAPDEAFNNGIVTIHYRIGINTGGGEADITIILEEEASHSLLAHQSSMTHSTPEDPVSLLEGDVFTRVPLYPAGELPKIITLNLIVMEGIVTLTTYPIRIRVVEDIGEYHVNILNMRIG